MASRHIRNRDLALLWGRAAGRCSFCKRNLLKEFPESGSVNSGQVAHILPSSKDGPRGDGIAAGSCDYENLILLCPSDHVEADGAVKDYTRTRLLEIKKNHEDFVRNSIGVDVIEDQLVLLAAASGAQVAQQIAPVLLIESSLHTSQAAWTPKFIKRMYGGSFGYSRVRVLVKNMGVTVAKRIALRIRPLRKTLPDQVYFSVDEHITRNSTTSSSALKVVCGPLNAGETIDAGYFYLNYRANQEICMTKAEFEFSMTCDASGLEVGNLSIANA